MRLNATRLGSIASSRSFGDQLDDLAGQVPSLDLNFARNKSLIDDYSGTTLITHTRASSATFVDSSGVLQRAVTNLCLQSENFTATTGTWTNFQATVSPNTAIAPNGTLTADTLIVNNAANGGLAQQQFLGLPDSTTYLFSVYIKAAGSTQVNIQFYNKANTFHGSKILNLATGVLTGTDFNGTSSVSSVGDGWYRLLYAGLNSGTGANSPNIRVVDPSTGNGTSGIYLWGAQLEQASTVGDYVPTTSVINSAPRFDHNPTTGESLGLLVEEPRTNVAWPSADYSGANWIKSNIQVSASTTTAPDGSTCFAYEGSSASSLIKRLRFNFLTTTVGAYTWSIYLKAGTEDSCAITLQDGTGNNGGNATILLTNGTVTAGPGNYGANTGAAVSVQALSNGFYRISLTTTFAAALTQIQAIVTWDANSSSTTTGTIFPWGAQLEAGAFPTSYIPTTTATVTRAADVASITGANFGVTRTNLLLRSEEFNNASWVKAAGASVNPDQIASPNGTITADQITGDGTQTGYVEQSVSIVNGTTYTYSIYLKKRTSSTCISLLYGAHFNSGGANCVSTWNFDTGVSSFTGAVTGSMTAVGNGWFRCLMVVTATTTNASASQQFLRLASNSGDVYAWGAQLETGSAATPYIPSTTTFTSRASGASYFDAAGVLQWKPQNLLVRSEEFNDAAWPRSGATLPTVTANAGVAPNGTTTADLWTRSITGSNFISQAIAKAASTIQYTFSVFVKQSVGNFCALRCQGTFPNKVDVVFNISSGAIHTPATVVGGTFTGPSASITPYPDNWYRITITATSDTATVYQCIVSFSSNGAVIDGIDTVSNSAGFLWGAQLEQNAGSFVAPGEYTPTVATATGGARNSAFLPDSSGVFRSAGPLLLEEARTNIISNSEDFGGAPWSLGGTTVAANAAVSPTGATTADSLLETTANSEHTVYVTSTQLFTTVTHSIYVKPNGRTNVALRFYHAAGDWVTTVFSLTGNGSVTQSSAGSSSGFSAVSRSIDNAGNGWYRISMTGTQTSRGTYGAVLDLCTSSTPTLASVNGSEVYAGDVTKGVYIWGAQLEAASTASSYIPTTGSTVTRAADVSTSTATSVFESSWYNQTEGTVFYEGTVSQGLANFPWFYNVSDGTVNNSIGVYQFTNGIYGGVVASGTPATPDPSVLFTPVSGAAAKHALAVKSSDTRAAYNAALSLAQTNTVMPVVNQLSIGARVNGNRMTGTIKRLTYWPTRLSNEVLQRITQP